MLNRIHNLSVVAIRTAAMAVVLAGCVIALTGCMSANTESDLPWNTPQTWEGTVQLPGMGGGGY